MPQGRAGGGEGEGEGRGEVGGAAQGPEASAWEGRTPEGTVDDPDGEGAALEAFATSSLGRPGRSG